MSNKSLFISYAHLREENERFVAKINAVWGAPVAWVAEIIMSPGITMPTIKSKMINGGMPDLPTPAFFAGPAPSVQHGR